MRTPFKILITGLLGTVAFIVAQEVMVTRGLEPKTIPEQKGSGVEPNIGISSNNRSSVAKLLNTLLADEYLLYVKTQNYHWNVTGLMFNDLHLFFGKQYNELSFIIDMVAERVRALGGHALGSMSSFIKNSRLKEQADTVPSDREMLRNLLNDHEAIIQVIRNDIDSSMNEFQDEGTANLLSDLITRHEKMAWMLRAYIS